MADDKVFNEAHSMAELLGLLGLYQSKPDVNALAAMVDKLCASDLSALLESMPELFEADATTLIQAEKEEEAELLKQQAQLASLLANDEKPQLQLNNPTHLATADVAAKRLAARLDTDLKVLNQLVLSLSPELLGAFAAYLSRVRVQQTVLSNKRSEAAMPLFNQAKSVSTLDKKVLVAAVTPDATRQLQLQLRTVIVNGLNDPRQGLSIIAGLQQVNRQCPRAQQSPQMKKMLARMEMVMALAGSGVNMTLRGSSVVAQLREKNPQNNQNSSFGAMVLTKHHQLNPASALNNPTLDAGKAQRVEKPVAPNPFNTNPYK